MGKNFRISSNSAYGRRIFPIMLALLACMIWASAAHAQDAPFDSQYDPPPTAPPAPADTSAPTAPPAPAASPECSAEEVADPASGCAPEVPSDTESPVEILPTTGGFLLAPALLGLAAVVGTGIVVVRRKR